MAAGFLSDEVIVSAFANSKGNFGYQKATSFDYTCTVRTEDGSGSGWVGHNVGAVAQFDAEAAIRIAIAKAKGSSGARRWSRGSTR